MRVASVINYKGLYITFLLIMVLSLPFSTFGLSFAQFGLLGTWLLEGLFRGQLRASVSRLFSNKPALILILFYLLHVVGLFYTTDLQYGLKDLRIKLPLLFLPILFVTSENLRSVSTGLLIKTYIGGVLAATLFSFWVLLTREISDFRELSPFISHIRLSLNVCLALFFTLYFLFHKQLIKYSYQVFLISMSIWFLAFLIMIESLTGLFIAAVLALLLTIYKVLKIKSRTIKLASSLILIAMPALLIFYINQSAQKFLTTETINIQKLDSVTAKGNPYLHDTVNFLVEHGTHIGHFICEDELQEEWEKRSSYSYNGLDDKKQHLRHTLMRYLNSKGFRKDAEGIDQLTQKDIRNIEIGIANYHYTRKFSLNSRLYKLFWEYQVVTRNMNPGGHSLIQRIEYWKASVAIIKSNWMTGVGTGDIKDAFASYYTETNSQLDMKFRFRAHNQYLATTVALGVPGLMIFLLSLIYPGIKLKKFRTYHYFVFWTTLTISMLVEDTLETQMGVTIFAFFNSFFLFGSTEFGKNDG